MLLVTGSLAYDNIMDFPGKFSDHIMPDKIHMLNVSFLVPKMQKGYGGTAGNISYTLALLGTQPTIYGVIGKDFAPYKQFLEKSGVDTGLLHSTDDHFTSTAFGITDKDDNQIWGFYPGADELSDTLSIADVILKNNRDDKHHFAIIAPHNPKAMLKHAGEYRKLGIPYLFDPGMQLRWLTGNDLITAFAGAAIIIGNDYEVGMMEKLTGIRDLHQEYGNKKIVITTLGAKGSRITSEGKLIHAEAVHLENPEDPSGAGDAFRAGFVAGYLRKLSIKSCGRMGALAAAYTVEEYGTVTHRFTVNEFEKRFKSVFNESIQL